MIHMKKINPREYMKGTKALRFRYYIYVGLVIFGTIFTVPAFYLMDKYKRPALELERRKKEEAEKQQLEIMYGLYEKSMARERVSEIGSK